MAVFAIAATALWFGAGSNAVDAKTGDKEAALAPQAALTFPGTGVGAIPDGNSGTPPQYGTPLTINFAVAGITGPMSGAAADITLNHSWVGDIDMVLRAPGGTPSLVLVSRIGVTTATSFGSSSDYAGTYAFTDAATGTNIWTAATATPVPAGSYRTTAPGQAGQTNPAPVTSLNTTFGGLTPAQANGTWTLTVRDAASSDTGSVTAANLTINFTPVVVGTNAPVDFNGDSKSDRVVVRNVGGGSNGQIRWFYNTNSPDSTVALDWGLAQDFFLMEDFDADGKDDVSVWRPGPAGTAAFYILNSLTNTARVETFGQTGDDPTIVDDYNNDGTADLAVYREGILPGDPSVWYFRTSPGGAVTSIPWGTTGDTAIPGDTNGDGSADFTIQRAVGGGAQFWTKLSTLAEQPVVFFGLATDEVVPGDYDGDSKIDLAVTRINGGGRDWYWRRSSDGVVVGPVPFGLSTDISTQGDYDGDGKVEPGIWRPSAGQFISRNSTNGAAQFFNLGSVGDYPVANYNSH